MFSRTVLVTSLALALQALAAAASAAPPKMAITFQADSAVATGITPGATVEWLGVSRAREEWSDHFYRWRLTTEDSDRDGTVTYPRPEGFPRETVLVAIDLATGGWAVGATYPLENDVPGPDLGDARTGPAGSLVSIPHRGSRVDILVARPGRGAWSARIVDGGSLDEDGAADGTVTIGVAALPARGGRAEQLDGIRPGDVVAMADASGPWVRVARFTGNGGKE